MLSDSAKNVAGSLCEKLAQHENKRLPGTKLRKGIINSVGITNIQLRADKAQLTKSSQDLLTGNRTMMNQKSAGPEQPLPTNQNGGATPLDDGSRT